jgi:hypothetical protein
MTRGDNQFFIDFPFPLKGLWFFRGFVKASSHYTSLGSIDLLSRYLEINRKNHEILRGYDIDQAWF